MNKPPTTQSEGRKSQVKVMFDKIAPSYDRLNHLLSFGIDRGWRRKLVKEMAAGNPKNILDLATGTADLAIAAASLKPDHITGTDIAEEMMAIGREKIRKKGLSELISLQYADSENLPFADQTFDAAMVAYGVRNYENLPRGLAEMARVLKPGGRAFILEFSEPASFPVKYLYRFYFNKLLPVAGRLVSKHSTAYTYLPESVAACPRDSEFTNLMLQSGFRSAVFRRLTFGITNLYIAQK